MRCPKCGYNSFDHLDSCKKCGKDLVEHKQKFGIVSVLFPGQENAGDTAAVEDEKSMDTAAAVAAGATAGVAAATGTAAEAEASEEDGFGFDFMGDSAEEEDMSFDELFEEAPADEDVEETLPSPEKETAATAAADKAVDDVSFDFTDDSGESEEPAFDDLFEETLEDEDVEDSLPSPEQKAEEPVAAAAEAGDDFDFDFTGDSGENVEPAFDDLFEESFEDEDVEDSLPSPEQMSKGTEEDPKSPFDLPESSQPEGAPGADLNHSVADLRRQSAASVEPPRHLLDSEESVAELFSCSGFESESSDRGDEQVDQVSVGLLPATGNRISAFCCDLLLLFLVGTSFVIAAEMAMSPAGDSLLPSMETLIDLSIPYFLVLFSLAFGYFTLFHFLAGQTPGKMLAGLRVETITGEPLLFSQAFLRSVGGLLQVLPAGLGYLVILSSSERRGWNDRLAGTRLVSLKGLSE